MGEGLEHDTRVCHDDEACRKLTFPRSAPEGKELVCSSFVHHFSQLFDRAHCNHQVSFLDVFQVLRSVQNRELTQSTRW